MLKGGTWKYRSQITLVPNPYYYGAKNFKLKEIDIVFTGTDETMFNAYKSGQYPDDLAALALRWPAPRACRSTTRRRCWAISGTP